MKAFESTQEPLLNEYDVARSLGVSVATVRRWRLLNRGPRFLKIGVLVKYRRADVEHWINSRPSGGSVTEAK
jgi:predicted DNA-binding transcriptional regulator AlpA